MGVVRPSFFAHAAMGSMPTATKVFTAGMFIELTSAVAQQHVAVEVLAVVLRLPADLVLGVVLDDGASTMTCGLGPVELLDAPPSRRGA